MPKNVKPTKTVKPNVVARQPSPKIELYLNKINQEKIHNHGSAAGCDIYGSWTKSCCILDFSLARPGDLVSNPMRGMFVRKEGESGGLIWNPRSGAVYKLNEDAYHVVLDIENGLSEIEIAKRNDMSLQAVQNFVKQIKGIA